MPIKEVKKEIASKLPVDPATRSPSPVEEKNNMSVRDKINRFKMNETADNNFQQSLLSSRRPRKTPIPTNPVTAKTITPSSNIVVSAKAFEPEETETEQNDKKVPLSDREVLSSPGQISVKGLAHRFSFSLKSSSHPDCLSQIRTLSGNKDFQQKAEVDTKKLLRPIARNKDGSPPSVPPKLDPKKIKGRVTNAMLLPCHENVKAMTLKERIEKLQSQSQPKL